jgi:CRP/FNR family transcriptional regulator
MRDFARRLRHFASLVEELSLKDVTSRLARFLLDEAASRGLHSPLGLQINLKISKRELASRLGTIPETLSRSLSGLSSAGVIKVKGRAVTILAPEALEKIAAGEK